MSSTTTQRSRLLPPVERRRRRGRGSRKAARMAARAKRTRRLSLCRWERCLKTERWSWGRTPKTPPWRNAEVSVSHTWLTRHAGNRSIYLQYHKASPWISCNLITKNLKMSVISGWLQRAHAVQVLFGACSAPTITFAAPIHWSRWTINVWQCRQHTQIWRTALPLMWTKSRPAAAHRATSWGNL